jgi:hypothetical protein
MDYSHKGFRSSIEGLAGMGKERREVTWRGF